MTSGTPGKANAIAAVAWDIDGTLVDSEPLHHRALVEVSRSHGVDLSDLPDQAFRGVHMADVWSALSRRMPLGLDERMWLKDIETHYAMHGHELRAMPHAVETVNALAARGIRQVCVSNSARMIVDANLEALGLTGLMEFSISLDDVPAGKPDPLPYAMACRRLGIDACQVLAVEDSATGLRSARAAGLVVAAYLDLGGHVDDADHIITDLSDVAGLLIQAAKPRG